MKKIIKIATTELQTLFYSPVAWFILVIFTFQVSSSFFGSLESWVDYFARGRKATGITFDIFTRQSGGGGLLPRVQQYLYLYIPLLTMGLMSREFNSGSIKLLYSSPITNTQIILGKYLSMVIYGLILMGILMIFHVYGMFTIKDYELATVFSGMLGLFLLVCAYAAIGLFMSSLTSYQVVAAIGTLAILALLSYMSAVWQDIPVVRDITYWLSISGRASTFIYGLIGSEDVLYFLIVIVLFLTLTIIRLQSNRQKSRWTVSLSKYVAVISIAMFLGYFSSRPIFRFYADVTHDKVNTLTPNSQEVIKGLKGGLTITTYVNALDDYMGYGLPRALNGDISRFNMYTRFKPEIKMKYVYYYDSSSGRTSSRFPNMTDKQKFDTITKINELNPKMFISPEEIRKQIDLSGEGNKFVRSIKRESGEQTFLRIYNDMTVMPGETEITAALKRLVMKLPKVGFLTGHDERDDKKTRDRDYSVFAQEKSFRYALLNQGFDVSEATLTGEIPADISILIIADVKNAFTDAEKINLDKYIARGGNLLIAGEPKQQAIMNPLVQQLGVQFAPGTLVTASENQLANLSVVNGTKEAESLMYVFERFYTQQYVATMPGAVALDYTTDKGFAVTPLLVSDSASWSELETTNFLDDTVLVNPSIGEVKGSYPTGLALSRKVGNKEQRIIVLGDADCISNGEMSMRRRNIWASNFTLVSGFFYWLSNNEVPIDVRRPESKDNELYIGKTGTVNSKRVFLWGFPALLILCSVGLWIRRRGR